jgi:glycosyltransferase involved in cell wall biosynthesis
MIDISYITSCYNAEEFLDGLIQDLRMQSVDNYEHIIVDSKSTDNSLDIANRWAKKDSRIRVVPQVKRTPYGVSWLLGWEYAHGEVVCNSNADDRSYPWRGTKVMEAYSLAMFSSDAQYNFYYGGYETRRGDLTIAKGTPPPYTREDMSQFFRCGVHVHWDDALDQVVDWDKMYRAAEEYKSAFDYWLVLYFMSLGAVGRSISNCFSIYNQRPDSLEQSDKERNTFETMRAIGTFYPNGPAMKDLETKTRIASPGFYQRYKRFLIGFDNNTEI